jgi:hypothetical protein
MADDPGPAESSEPDPPETTAPVAATRRPPGDDERAAQLLRDAEGAAAQRGREMVNQARVVRKRMLDDVDRRRRILLDELDRVRDLLDELAGGLDEPVRPDETSPPAASPDHTRDEPAARDLFARLREEHERGDRADASPAPVPAPATRETSDESAPAPDTPDPPDAVDSTTDEAPDQTAPGSEPEAPSAPPPAPSPDDATRRRRDEVLAPLTVPLLRASKRLLQDESNDILDAIRRSRGRVEASRLLPDMENQHAAWSAVLAPTIDEAYTVGRALTGRGRRPTSVPRRLVAELAAGLITPLRERLTAGIDAVLAEGPHESVSELHAALGPAISARYREWRAHDLENLLGDLLAVAYARGAYDATPSGATLRWVPAEVGRCPDADDNALEPTVKGQRFPTGQAYPPAHPGCRCLVVPTDRDPAPDPTEPPGRTAPMTGAH